MTARIFNLVLTTIIFLTAMPSLNASDAPKAALTVSPLRKSDIDYGCGCSFHYPPRLEYKGATVLQWHLGNKGNLRVNNRTYRLSVQPEYLIATPKVGDVVSFGLQGEDLTVSVECRITRVCGEKDEACEVTLMRGRMTVQKENDRAQLPVWGNCGC
ncbi:MAG TPA: hypothetical protein VKH64_02785 [Candidatus Binatia bacterium]|nr:hypothetical protein [Candidatus Binatia bacterium]